MRAFASVKNGYVETLSTDKRAGQLLSRETGTGIPVAPNSRKAVPLPQLPVNFALWSTDDVSKGTRAFE